MNKIYCIGEALIDFIPKQQNTMLLLVPEFERVVGGAPCNCAISIGRIGGNVAFIGMVGNDPFGQLIYNTLKISNVDVENLITTKKANTALAFVTECDEDRDFLFYRNPYSADMLLSEADINVKMFEENSILHFCSVDLIDAPVKNAHRKALDCVNRVNGIASFDINLRPMLWDSETKSRATILEFLKYADVIKVSYDEGVFVFGNDDPGKWAETCFRAGAKVMFLTKGANGCAVYKKEFYHEIPSLKVRVVDTLGAGDAFSGGYLKKLQESESFEQFLNEGYLISTLEYANELGAMAVQRKGV